MILNQEKKIQIVRFERGQVFVLQFLIFNYNFSLIKQTFKKNNKNAHILKRRSIMAQSGKKKTLTDIKKPVD